MIEVRLSCEESDLPALRSLVMEWLFPKVKESKTVPAEPAERPLQEASSAQPEMPQGLEVPKAKKPEKVPLSEEIKAEILRLAGVGLRPKEIAAKLGVDGWQVKGVFVGNLRRERMREKCKRVGRADAEAPKEVTKEATKEATKEVTKEVTPKPIPDTDLDARIMEMYSLLTCKEISTELEREGIDLTSKEISQKIKEIQLRALGKQAGQTIEKQVPKQPNVAESIPAFTEESPQKPVQECAALQEGESPQKEDPPGRFITPAKINGEIWDLTKAGLTPKDISDHLNLKGLQWTEGMVEKRLEKIRAGAA